MGKSHSGNPPTPIFLFLGIYVNKIKIMIPPLTNDVWGKVVLPRMFIGFL